MRGCTPARRCGRRAGRGRRRRRFRGHRHARRPARRARLRGQQLGGALPGDRAGMRGGEILVHGDAGDQVGAGLRRGLIAVAGRVGTPRGCACWRARSSLSAARRRAGGRHAAGHDRGHVGGRRCCPPSPSRARTARPSCACTCATCAGWAWRWPTSRSRSLRALERRRPRAAARRDPDLRGGRLSADGGEHGTRLQQHLLELRLGVGRRHDRPAGADPEAIGDATSVRMTTLRSAVPFTARNPRTPE